MRTIIVTGAKGQLGTELVNIMTSGKSELGKLSDFYESCQIVPIDIADLNIADQKNTEDFILQNSPYAVINCAAMTNVDACEDHRELAMKVNAIGARNLARSCEKVGAKLLQISTDYVFDGTGKPPYDETHLPNPQSVYGATKLLGEQYVREFCSRWFVLRTAWLYGYHGNNFVKSIARKAKQTGAVKVVTDQVGTPTNAADLAWEICKIIPTKEYGVYHCTGNGEICSWYDFACAIVEGFQIDATVTPCSSAELNRAATRPAYSALDNRMLRCTVGDDMRDWREALAAFCANAALD